MLKRIKAGVKAEVGKYSGYTLNFEENEKNQLISMLGTGNGITYCDDKVLKHYNDGATKNSFKDEVIELLNADTSSSDDPGGSGSDIVLLRGYDKNVKYVIKLIKHNEHEKLMQFFEGNFDVDVEKAQLPLGGAAGKRVLQFNGKATTLIPYLAVFFNDGVTSDGGQEGAPTPTTFYGIIMPGIEPEYKKKFDLKGSFVNRYTMEAANEEHDISPPTQKDIDLLGRRIPFGGHHFLEDIISNQPSLEKLKTLNQSIRCLQISSLPYDIYSARFFNFVLYYVFGPLLLSTGEDADDADAKKQKELDWYKTHPFSDFKLSKLEFKKLIDGLKTLKNDVIMMETAKVMDYSLLMYICDNNDAPQSKLHSFKIKHGRTIKEVYFGLIDYLAPGPCESGTAEGEEENCLKETFTNSKTNRKGEVYNWGKNYQYTKSLYSCAAAAGGKRKTKKKKRKTKRNNRRTKRKKVKENRRTKRK